MVPRRAASWHADLHTFGADRLELHLVGIFDVQPVPYGFERRHPAKHLERYLYGLVGLRQHDRLVNDFARRLLGAREGATQHRAIAAEEKRFHERAVPL
jgi:hypothetical protein